MGGAQRTQISKRHSGGNWQDYSWIWLVKREWPRTKDGLLGPLEEQCSLLHIEKWASNEVNPKTRP